MSALVDATLKTYITSIVKHAETQVAAAAPVLGDAPEIAADKVETVAYYNQVRTYALGFYSLP